MQIDGFKPPTVLALSSSFYTVALEQPFVQELSRRGQEITVICAPYNQLYTFLLNPGSVIPENTPTITILFLRIEDLIRLELASASQAIAGAGTCVRAIRERTTQCLEVLSRLSHLRLTTLICPSGRGAYDVAFLDNSIRVAEHKIAAELRRQHRHLLVGWSEFESPAKPENIFNQSGDRLGHVPFSPVGLDALACFCVSQLHRMPVSQISQKVEGESTADLGRFLASLEVEMKVARLTGEDERQAVDLGRHTTHFINVLHHNWTPGGIQALTDSMPRGEGWTVRVRDRFGDYGVSGALAFGIEDRTMRVGLFFLTCPVLGRQMEYAFMGWIAELAKRRDAESIEVPFTAGKDNGGLGDLLATLGEQAPGDASLGAPPFFRLKVAGLEEKLISRAPYPPGVGTILAKLQVEEPQPTANVWSN